MRNEANVRAEGLAALEQAIGYRFYDRSLLAQALCHSSYANEAADGAIESNERLEFLGDAVLELAITSLIFERCTRCGEGQLTTLRANLVRTETLAQMARRIGLGAHLLLGKGAEKNGERENDSVLEDAFEAMLGAVFLDGTAAAARKVVRLLFSDTVEEQLRLIWGGERFYDYKTTLQIELQRDGSRVIRYETIDESGPDHDKTFRVRVLVGGDVLGEGEGKTKKRAEQHAAKMALEGIGCI